MSIFKKRNLQNAFTLAEVLIVLAVIGVVAAMTMPMLTSNYQKTQYVSAFKKVYSQFSEAVERNMNDENVENFSETSLIFSKDGGGNFDPTPFFKKYFKVSKYCETHWTECFSSESSDIKTKTKGETLPDGTHASVILKDGTAVAVYIFGADQDPVAEVSIDTNGKNSPNIAGRDLIMFYIYADGSVDDVSPDELFTKGATARNGVADACDKKHYGIGCLSRLINDGWKMEY